MGAVQGGGASGGSRVGGGLTWVWGAVNAKWHGLISFVKDDARECE